jgi:hypothetical protein
VQIAERVYTQLQPDERFRAAVEAFSRRDEAEMDRLNDTCPYETVRIQSLAYFYRLQGFIELAMTHGILARDVMLGVWVCMWKIQRESESAFIHSSGAAADDGSDQPCEDSLEAETQVDDPDDADEAISTLGRLIGRLKAYRSAWADFCESVGVDPTMTDFAYYNESQGITELLEEFKTDLDLRAQQLELLRNAWTLRARRR